MIASWMLYATLASALFALVAVLGERLIGAGRRPVRFVWMTTLTLSLGWPCGVAVQRLLPRPLTPVAAAPFSITLQSAHVTTEPLGQDGAAMIDRALAALWIASSGLLLARLFYGLATIGRSRRAWPSAVIDGKAVKLSANIGPAVVGLRPMDVVLPEWITTLDAPLRAIVLRHEEEHRSARDPYVLFAAAIAVALMPWNLAIWFQARRLRLAIEMDCDARVLRVHHSRERYGLLMMTVAQRRSASPTAFAPMMSDSPTQLERRISAMQQNIPRLGKLAIAGGSAAMIGIFALACSLRPDVTTNAQPTAPSPAASAAPSAPFAEFKLDEVTKPLPGNRAPRYPAEMRKAGRDGEVKAAFVVDTSGAVDTATFKVMSSTDPLFTAAVRQALPGFKFSPATMHGRHVRQLLQMPFQFNLAKDDAVAPARSQLKPRP